ncbi:MAG: tRNA (guanosine(37)-N1)-methyltransferase TrmD [Actinomycetes bacterium]
MRIDLVSIFPQYLEPLKLSLIGKAIDAELIDLRLHDLRAWTNDRHNTVDDTPYGGGPGMVMMPEPWGRALDEIRGSGGTKPTLVVPTPSGAPFTQGLAQSWSDEPWLVIACGRYEGIDSRVMQHYATRDDWNGVSEVTIGDYVLAGGEVAAMVIVEAVGRLIPGVLGNQESAADDSFSMSADSALVEGPVFTKPQEWRGIAIPDVLTSGHHANIAQWRLEQAQERTAEKRPDL